MSKKIYKGSNIIAGGDGRSAYQVWLDQGHVGTEADFLASLKGDKGDTGVSADYPITIYNGLDSTATDEALAANQGKALDDKIGQLGQEVEQYPIRQVGYWSNSQNRYVSDSGYSLFIPIVGYSSIYVKGRSNASGEVAFVTAFSSNSVSFVSGVSGTTTISAGGSTTLSVPSGAKYLMVFDTSSTNQDRKPVTIIADNYRELYIGQLEDLWNNDAQNKQSINGVKADIEDLGHLTYGRYYDYANNEIDLDEPLSSDSFLSAKIKCNSGDKWFIKGQGGSTARLWAFVNSDNTVISISAESLNSSGVILVAPSDCYLVINVNKNTNYMLVRYSDADYYFANGEYQYIYAKLNYIDSTSIHIDSITFKKWGGATTTISPNTDYDFSSYSFLLLREGSLATESSSSNIRAADTVLIAYTSQNGFCGGILLPSLHGKDIETAFAKLEQTAALLPGYYEYADGKVNSFISSSATLVCSRIKCNTGDKWYIKGTGGGTARLWAFVQDDGTVISISDALVSTNGLVLTAPSSCYLVVNFSTTGINYSLLRYSDSDYYFANGNFQVVYATLNAINDHSVHIDTITFKKWGKALEQVSVNNDYDMWNYSFLLLRGGAIVTENSSSNIQATDIVLLVFTTAGGLSGGLLLPFIDLSLLKQQYNYFENLIKKRNSICFTPWTALQALPLNDGTEGAISAGEKASFPYSSVKELDKYIGFDVSVYTFLTAAANQYSLLYTENVNGEHSRSAYGITYHGTNCGTYFGMVCNIHSCYTRGLTIPYNSGEHPWMCDVGKLTKREIQDAAHTQVGDILRRPGHCAIVVEKGKTYITISEATGPLQYHHPLTYSAFNDRLVNNNDTVYFVSDKYAHNLSAKLDTNWHYSADNDASNFNRDICCFAGDRALFREGDIVAVNYNLDSVGDWTHIELYKDNVLIQTIAIDSSVHTLLLTSYCGTKGIYKARMKNGTSFSEFTYWKVIDTNVSYTQSEGITTIQFASSMAEPLYLEVCELSGKTWLIYELSGREIGQGSCTIDITNLMKAQHDGEVATEDLYIKVHFEDEFGRVTNEYLALS